MSIDVYRPNEVAPSVADQITCQKGDWLIWQKPGTTGKMYINFNNRGWSLFPPETTIAVYNTSFIVSDGAGVDCVVMDLTGIERFSLY